MCRVEVDSNKHAQKPVGGKGLQGLAILSLLAQIRRPPVHSLSGLLCEGYFAGHGIPLCRGRCHPESLILFTEQK